MVFGFRNAMWKVPESDNKTRTEQGLNSHFLMLIALDLFFILDVNKRNPNLCGQSPAAPKVSGCDCGGHNFGC